MTITKRIIYPTANGGVAVVTPTGELPIEELIVRVVPPGVSYEIIEVDEVPTDRTFRNAWVMGDCCIDHDLDKCKAIGHAKRRTKRAEEFAPHDEVIAKQIPGADAAAAEAARQAIRDKYADIQDAIDAADTPEEIKVALASDT
jgi:hypothetical protein